MPHASVPDGSALRRERPPGLSRRACMERTISGIVALPLLGRFAFLSEAFAAQDDTAEIADVKALGKKAGLAPFSDAHSKHFLGLGDAGPAYCEDALAICEALAPEFLSHFRDRGFKLALPPNRMTVITLKDAASYRALLGEDKGASVGGHYDLETNRLVVFDNRGTDEELPDSPERVNRFTLTHETLHLLSYNTGLLSRQLDVPACISEGLSTYGELWQYRGKTKIGATNNARLRALTDPRAGGGAWIPIRELLAKDDFFNDDKTAQLAYAEAWAAGALPAQARCEDACEVSRLSREASDAARRGQAARGRRGRARLTRGARRASQTPRQGAAPEGKMSFDGVLAQPSTGLSPMFLRISARCFS